MRIGSGVGSGATKQDRASTGFLKSKFVILNEYKFVNILLIIILFILLIIPFFIYIPNISNESNFLKLTMPTCFVKKTLGHNCPTCGITRSIVALYNNKWGMSIHFNPNGFLIVIALVVQLLLRSIPIIVKKMWVPWMDIFQMTIMGIGFKVLFLI
ncbi:MAG: DUF2752 domain-containing protein [Thermodesulfovibrionales bacterium]|nr:DUF2752 domain-containing protein [Thermodesulfovibrionales bacterium]